MGREEEAFGFGSFLSLTYVHFETKHCKVVVNQVQDLCKLIAVFERERFVVYVKNAEEGE